MNLRAASRLLAVSISCAAFGAVSVTPPAPTSTDTIAIRVENAFGAEASVASASIMQVGTSFVIQQNVNFICSLPSNPIVASEFQVGPLAAGSYTVTVNISFADPLCRPRSPITQTAAFTVGPGAEVPALDGPGLLLLGVVLAATGLLVLRVRT